MREIKREPPVGGSRFLIQVMRLLWLTLLWGSCLWDAFCALCMGDAAAEQAFCSKG